MQGISIADLCGVGPLMTQVFERAGFARSTELVALAGQELAVKNAAESLCRELGPVQAAHWRNLAQRCSEVIGAVRSVRGDQISPFAFMPECTMCPLTFKTLEDPVVSNDGHSYERAALEQVLLDPEDRLTMELRSIGRGLVVISNPALVAVIKDMQTRVSRYAGEE